MTIIYLVRHAQASLGQANYDQLSVAGQVQAKLCGKYLTTFLDEHCCVVTGTMQRHIDTAQLALKDSFPQLMMQSDVCWNEFDHQDILKQYSTFMGLTQQLDQALLQAKNNVKPLMSLFNAAMQHWMSAQEHSLYAESWQDFTQRVIQGLNHVLATVQQQQCRQMVIFSSGGVIATVLGQLLSLSPTKILQLNSALTNVSISSLHLPTSASHLSEANVLSINEHHYLKTAQMWMDQSEQDLRIANETLLTWV
jgi:broad specificity phosphatase PhoE